VLGDFWARDGDALRSKKNPRAKIPILNHFPFVAGFSIKIFISHPSFENKYPAFDSDTPLAGSRGIE